MENGKTYGKQTPEEVARAAQEAALKSAMEQAQSMLENISGMNMRGTCRHRLCLRCRLLFRILQKKT